MNKPTADRVRANVLIVDDRSDKLLVFKTVLDELDEQIITMSSGEEALRWLLEHDCAVILLDINMPGMDGFETARLIRSRPRSAHIPIIFITAQADETHTMKGYSLGAVDFIMAPVLPVVLRSKVAVFVQLFRLTQQIEQKAEQRVALAREQSARAVAEESLRGAAFLAEASKVLSSSLDVGSLLANATRLAVPMLGDLSAIVLAQGKDIAAPVVHAREGILSAGIDALAQDPVWRDTVLEVMAIARVKFVENFRVPAMPPGAPLQEGRQMVVLPLIARGRVHGALSLVTGPGHRAYTATDIALATDIAGHVGMALDNCLMFREIQSANERNNEFLVTLSHELRNPLAPMRNAVYSMHLAGLWAPEALKFKAIIERQLEHMTRLVDDLLDVARITRGKIQLRTERVDLVEKLYRVLETCRPQVEKAGHRLTLDLPSEPVWIKADRVRMQQIFENILVNAIKYTDPGGRIEITLRVENQQAITVIRDNGVGIAPEMVPRIWDMFVQVEASADRVSNGLGLGLPLARKLAFLHGGAVECASPGLGQGSAFTVRIPLMASVPRDAPGSREASAAPQPKAPTGRILVVDDNQDAAQSLGVLLNRWGHTVELAYDGASALEIARTFRPELVFLDIGMPKMNGYEVARRLKEDTRLASTRFIVLSGYGAEVDHMRSKEAGFDHHLVKPVDPRQLPELITSVLNARSRLAASNQSASKPPAN